MSRGSVDGSMLDRRLREMMFAFVDPLGVALARQIVAELYSDDIDARQDYIKALVHALKGHMRDGLGACGKTGRIPTADFSAYRLHRVVNAIHATPEADHSIERMAAEAGIGASHFSHVFRQAFGLSPHQFVLKVRLERAAEMLLQSNMSIAMISEMLGFTSQSHFSRAFRGRYGTTPTEYRK